MKRFAVSAVFPDLLAKDAIKATRASGSDVRIAINKALKEILALDGVRGKQIKRGTITFAFVAGIDEPDKSISPMDNPLTDEVGRGEQY